MASSSCCCLPSQRDTTRLKTGTLNAALFRDPAIYAQSKKDGMSTIDIPQIAGNLMIMNSGIDITCTTATSASIPACAGQPDGTKVQTKTATRDPERPQSGRRRR